MKGFMVVIGLVLVSGFVLVGCPSPTGSNNGPVIPEERGSHGNDTPIPLSRGEVIIRGENLYPSEWAGMTDKILTVLEGRGAAWFGGIANTAHNIHGHHLSIIVISTNEFNDYKTSIAGDRIYININTKDLVNTMEQAFMGWSGQAPEMVRAVPSARETVRMAKVPVASDTRAIVAQTLGEKVTLSVSHSNFISGT